MDFLTRYQQDGATVVRGAFGPQWVGPLREAIAREMAAPGPGSEDYVSKGDTGTFFESTYLWRRHRAFRDFAYRSQAKDIARACLRSGTVRLFYDQIFVKEPATSKATPWHQDKPYWALKGTQMCSIWLALDPIAEEDCLKFIAGSHRWGRFRARHFLDGTFYQGQEDQPPVPDLPDSDGDCDILSWPMETGDCILFHPLTVHGAPGNSSATARRRAVATRWIGDDVRYRKVAHEFAFPRGAAGLSDGDPLPEHLAPHID